jgi:hypothetical protein
MFKALAFASVVAAGTVLTPTSNTSSASGTACRAADTTTSLEIIALQHEMHSTSDVDSAFINNGRLPYVADSAIVVVSDSTVCARALSAHNAVAGYTNAELAAPASSSIYVIRVGGVYVTFNPAFRSGEFVNHFVWDSSFHLLANWL